MATDPVCGMTADDDSATATTDHGGTTYYFCAQGCKESFESDPSEYV